jgi:hypothetical protein
MTYQLLKSSNQSKCYKQQCSEELSLTWLYKEPCNFKTICTDLQGNICGDYGVQVVYSISKIQDICFPNLTYSGEMIENITVKLWYSKGSSYMVDCYSWCETNIDFGISQSQLASQQLLVDLVRPFTNMALRLFAMVLLLRCLCLSSLAWCLRLSAFLSAFAC